VGILHAHLRDSDLSKDGTSWGAVSDVRHDAQHARLNFASNLP
jgi:hypothetical protein